MSSDISRLSRPGPRLVPSLPARAANDVFPTANPEVPVLKCRSILEDLLQQTVISRLRLAHPGQVAMDAPHEPHQRIVVNPDHVDGFAQVLRFETQAEVDHCAEWLIEHECGLEGLLLDLVPQVEARLHGSAAEGPGEHATITLGEWRLTELVERLAPRYQAASTAPRHERRALLGTAEPAAFRLRLAITAEQLTHAGWDVFSETTCPLRELPDLLHGAWFALAVVASDSTEVEVLAGAIRGMRKASMNEDVRLLVLSAALVRRPDRLVRVGADAAAGDVRQAAIQADRLLSLIPSGR